MEEAYKEIAPRLKGLRDAMDWDVAELARRAGVDTVDVERYESGREEIPIGYLLKVSQASGVEMNTLIAGNEAHLTGHSLVRSGRGLAVDRRKDYDYKSLAYRFKGRRMEPFEITVPAKEPQDMTFTAHAGQEFIYMLEGRLEVRLEQNAVEMAPGDSLYFDSQTPHALRGLDGKPARFLDVIL